MSFWDSSAIVPLLLEEVFSSELLSLSRSERGKMVVWWGTMIECHSAISRRRRSGIITEEDERSILRLLMDIQEAWREISSEEGLREEAIRLIHFFPLRAVDALQLAAAMIWTNHRPAGRTFVCLDDRLREAASLEGFRLIPEIIP